MIPALDVPASTSNSSPVVAASVFNHHHIKEVEETDGEDNIGPEDNKKQQLYGYESDDQDHCGDFQGSSAGEEISLPTLIEKSVIIHTDENGFGLRVKGQAPVLVEHVHENGAAWRAGVRELDRISKVNGVPVNGLEHKDVVLMFKSCNRFVGLTLQSSVAPAHCSETQHLCTSQRHHPRQLIGSTPPPPPPPESAAFGNPTPTDSLFCDLESSSFDGRRKAVAPFGRQPLQLRSNSQLSTSAFRLATNGSSYKQQATSPQVTRSAAGASSARRSESVLLRPSYLSQQLQEQQSQQVDSAEVARGERRTSEGEACEARRGSQDGKRMAVCINCRSPIRQEQGASGLTCLQCQLNFNPQISQRQAQVQHEAGGSGGLASNGSPREPFYKLGLSASTNSLPAKSNNSADADNQPQRRQPVNKRLEIIREFIDTERTHTERLRCLDELFYRPLKAGNLLTTEQLRQVFSCHRTLYKIHRQIYRILLSANYSLYAEPLIGSALLEIFEGELKRRLERAACTYCASQSNNVELLNKLTRRDTKVGEFLAQVTSQQMVGRLGIKDLLASCFQRLTKYPLLLESLLKATPQPPTLESPSKGSAGEEEPSQARQARRMLAISLAEEREFIGRALNQSRQILVRVNESVKVAVSHNKLKEIWKRTDKYPGVPLIDITKQQVVHEGPLTLRLAKRSFDVYVLLLNDYIIILTREGQDKYRLKFFTPEGKSSSSFSATQSVYSPVFVIDEHLTTRDAATDENGFYLLCKRKDDSRIYEFASRSPAERLKWRDHIQWTIERHMLEGSRRNSCESSITKSSSEVSTSRSEKDEALGPSGDEPAPTNPVRSAATKCPEDAPIRAEQGSPKKSNEPAKIEGTISYVEDDGIVLPSKMESSRVLVDQAVQV